MSTKQFATLGLSVGLAALLSSAAIAQAPTAPPKPEVIKDYKPVTAETLTNPAPGDWPFYRRTYNGWGHSPLKQIDTTNVAKLQPVWSLATGYQEGHEAPPQVVNGVMFVSTAGNQVLAINPADGEILWRYKRELPPDMLGSHPTNRGLGFWGDNVFFVSRDSVLVALDAKSGAEKWTATMQDYRKGYYANLAPLVVDGKVLVGTSGGERGVRGYIAAYDSETGKEVWRTHLVPAPGEPGSETWPKNDTWKTGGASSWITGHYDPATKLVYWGTGNGGPWMGDQRPGDNLYVTSVVALDVGSGAIKGHFQYHQNDSWDWDEVAAPILVDLPKGGANVPGLVHVARNGHMYFLERTPTGPINFLSAKPYVFTNWVKSIDPKTGRIEVAEGKKPGTGVLGDFCPSFWGGKDWPPIAYNPDTKYVYIPANENLCSTLQGGAVEYIPGAAYTRGTQGAVLTLYLRDKSKSAIGEVQAWDTTTGEKVWTKSFDGTANWGPLLSTGGGLIFGGGTNDRKFRAFDAKSGNILWETRLNSGVVGVPSSFEINGKQYVSVVAGFGIDAIGMQSRLSTDYPDKFKSLGQTAVGGTIYTFAVP